MRRLPRVLGGAFVVVVLGVLTLRFAAARHESAPAKDAAPRTGRYVHAADAQMFFQEEGPKDGPAIVLIHGTGAWSEIWRGTLHSLGVAGYRAIALDMPPFGYSVVPDGAKFTDEAQARRILGVIEALQLESVAFVGHSFGARPTMQAVFQAGPRVRGLVLVDSALGLAKGSAEPSRVLQSLLGVSWVRNALVSCTLTNRMLTRRLFSTLVSEAGAVTPERVAMLQRPFVVERTTERTADWLLPFVSTNELSMANDRKRYPQIAFPTLVLWGSRDTITPLAQGRDIAALIPNSEWVELPRAGHIPAIEQPAEFDAAVLKFLRARLPVVPPSEPAPPPAH